MKTGYIAVIVIAVIAVGGVGYIIYNNSQKKNANEILLGATVSLTGKYSTEGNRVLHGYKMAIADINAAGGVDVNGTKYQLKLKSYDDQSEKTQAATLYDTLITQDKVDVLLGPYSSSNVLSVAPVAENAKIPFVQAGGSSDTIYSQGLKYTFGLYRVASTYTAPLFTWLNDSTNVNNVATAASFVETDSFSTSVWGDNATGARHFVNTAGLTLVGHYTYTAGDSQSIQSSMTLLKNAGGADIIMFIGHYGDAKTVVNDIVSNSLTPKIVFGTVGVPEPTFVKEVGATNTNDVMGFAQWVTNIPESAAPGITAFVQKYNQTYGELPAYHAAGGYAAVQVVAAAITAAKTFTDHAAVRDALAAININTVWGHVQFSATGVIQGSGYMVQIQNGKIETVYPAAYKTANIIFPKT